MQSPLTKVVLVDINILATWVQQIKDDNSWAPYTADYGHQDVPIQQCKHKERYDRIWALYKKPSQVLGDIREGKAQIFKITGPN